MSRMRGAVVCLTVLLVAAAGAGPARSAQERPNVLLVISDDLGWPFYHFMIQELRREYPQGPNGFASGQHPAETNAHEVEPCPPARNQFPTSPCTVCQPNNGLKDLDLCTPNLDALANEGVAFHRGYDTAPDCDSSRPSIFTGLNRHDLTGSGGGCGTRSPYGPQTIGEALARLGYRTLLAGKLEAGGNGPKALGFLRWDASGQVGEQKGLQFIKKFLADPKVPAGKPWFVVWSPKTPHFEYFLPKKGFGPAKNLFFTNLYRGMDTDAPHFFTGNGGVPDIAKYLPSITYFDARLGELLQFLADLEDAATTGRNPNPAFDPYLGTAPAFLSTPPARNYAGFSSNTLVVYVGDNGAALPNSKANFGENGQRTPIIVRPPPASGAVPDSVRQAVKFDLVGTIDVFPTILAYADPNGTLAQRRWPDARNLRRRIESCDDARPLFFSSLNTDGNGATAVRDAQHKLYANLVKNNGIVIDFTKCFDLVADPFETGVPRPIDECAALEQPLGAWAVERMNAACKDSLTTCACTQIRNCAPDSCGLDPATTTLTGSSTDDAFCPAP